MKKSIALLLAFAMVFLLGACGVRTQGQGVEPSGSGVAAQPQQETENPTEGSSNALEVQTQYIRTDGGREGDVYPAVRVIPDREALEGYYAQNRHAYYLDRREKVYSDSTVGFLDACDRYDRKFFEEHYLVLVLLEEGSGSIRHRVEGVTATEGGSISVCVTTLIPEVGSEDMAQWHLILELKNEGGVPAETDFRLYLDGKLRWDRGNSVIPLSVPAYTVPPGGTLHTPEGSYPLSAAGYSWFYAQGDLICAANADRAWPPAKEALVPLELSGKYAETVYEPQQDGSYAATEELGYFLKLDWPACPDEITVACWEETVWDRGAVREEPAVVMNVGGFYAKAGAYVYEISASWEDRGVGWHGTANYYAWIRTPDHGHQLAEEPQRVKDPYVGYCGNTWTTLYVGEDTYRFMFGNSLALTDLLLNLDYRQKEVCRCMAEYRVDTEFALGYEVNLTEGFARCGKGQAKLTRQQVEQIREIITWAVTTDCEYPLDG